ncbi:ribonuclease H1-like isoform X2 [Amphiura filiformis]|uniref:ribonuclease H1-like isoform X2 n=1 Tax=Amphiura filiformis TaxID=82378 RepID=UPI003B21591E
MSFIGRNRPLIEFSRGIVQNIIMGKAGKPGYYAVRRGRRVGVYRTWDECKANVDKFNGARYKKFPSEEEAWRFVNDTDGAPQQPAATAATATRYQPYTQPNRSARRGQNGADCESTDSTQSHCSCCPCGHNNSDQQHPTAASAAAPTSAISSVNSVLLPSSKPYEYNATQAAHATTRKTRASNFAKRQYSDDATTSEKKAAETPKQQNGVVVYTDGACSFNGQKGARAGIGVYWGNKHPDNVSQRLKGRQTNQRAEIMAAVYAIEKAGSKGIPKITLYTDSKYTINCITKWMAKWKTNGWQTVNNKDVHNKTDLVRLDRACQNVDVQWEYVPGHQNVAGNEAADKLATSGAQLPYTYPTKKNPKGEDEFYDDSDSDEWGY